MIYLLDTVSVSYALRGQGNVASRIAACKPSEFAISSITLAELRLGAERMHSKRLHALIDAFAAAITVAPFDATAAEEFGRLGALLAERGTPIGEFDVMIAAHAISLKYTLVTNNLRHFARMPGLKIETWA